MNTLIGGSTSIEGVVPGPCSGPGLGLTCVAGVPGGVRSIRQKPKGARSTPGATGERQIGRVKNLNLWLMSRYGQLRWWDAGAEYKDSPLGSGRRRLGSSLNREEHRCPRDTGGTHPGRSSCVRNAVTPVGVRAATSGKPTARKAQPSGGNLMAEKQRPAVERQQETGTRMAGPFSRPFRITGRTRAWCPDAKAC